MIWRHLELNVVSQAVFGVLDLEREGQVPQDLKFKGLEHVLPAGSLATAAAGTTLHEGE